MRCCAQVFIHQISKVRVWTRAHTHTHTHAYVRSLYVFDFKNENNNFVLRSYRGVFALILTLQYLAGYDKSRDKKLDSDIYLYNQKKSTCFCESRKTFYLVHDEKVEMEMLKTYRQYILQHLFLHRLPGIYLLNIVLSGKMHA